MPVSGISYVHLLPLRVFRVSAENIRASCKMREDPAASSFSRLVSFSRARARATVISKFVSSASYHPRDAITPGIHHAILREFLIILLAAPVYLR